MGERDRRRASALAEAFAPGPRGGPCPQSSSGSTPGTRPSDASPSTGTIGARTRDQQRPIGASRRRTGHVQVLAVHLGRAIRRRAGGGCERRGPLPRAPHAVEGNPVRIRGRAGHPTGIGLRHGRRRGFQAIRQSSSAAHHDPHAFACAHFFHDEHHARLDGSTLPPRLRDGRVSSFSR